MSQSLKIVFIYYTHSFLDWLGPNGPDRFSDAITLEGSGAAGLACWNPKVRNIDLIVPITPPVCGIGSPLFKRSSGYRRSTPAAIESSMSIGIGGLPASGS